MKKLLFILLPLLMLLGCNNSTVSEPEPVYVGTWTMSGGFKDAPGTWTETYEISSTTIKFTDVWNGELNLFYEGTLKELSSATIEITITDTNARDLNIGDQFEAMYIVEGDELSINEGFGWYVYKKK